MAFSKSVSMPCPDGVDTKPQGASIPAEKRSWVVRKLRAWFDTSAVIDVDDERADRIDWLRAAPFIAMHLACIAVIWVGVSPVALIVAAALYAVRMFAITGFYHRYFSHRTFRTSRAVQFIFALIGASCVQRGPLCGRRITAIIIAMPIPRWTRIRRTSTVSSGAMWAGFSPRATSRPIYRVCRI